MSIKDRRSRENVQLREKILNAALRIFAEQGHRKVSMRKIAALIDYSPTTIYRFFRNKQELLGAIAAKTYADLAAQFEKVKAEDGDGPLGMLKSVVREYVVFCVGRPDMVKLYLDLASFEMEDGVMYERVGGKRYRVYQSWLHGIKRSIESGALDIKDEKRVFLYLWDSVNGYVYHRVNHPRVPRKPLAEDCAEYLRLVFRGIETKKNLE